MRRRSILVFILLLTVCFLLSAFVFPVPASLASPASWWRLAEDGITGGFEPIQHMPSAMVVFGGRLFVATSGGANGC